ncbi:hypothetical protein [Streptomyces sp. NPDC051636]|uniref:hypothetical protein n=1 Tax=Streptomyces sp. NPDC051636 TaxID=3365663 RepID=UPI0037A21BDC
MTTTSPEQPMLTSQTWAGHWHGFGPWIGAPDVYAAEGNRRPVHALQPGPGANFDTARHHQAGAEFASSNLPPLMTGHWLMKKNQTTRVSTWTDAAEAVDWLKEHYTANQPFERSDGLQAYVELDAKLAYALDVLPRGVDVSWVHHTQSRSLFSASIVCCPNLFHPTIPCPLPPS